MRVARHATHTTCGWPEPRSGTSAPFCRQRPDRKCSRHTRAPPSTHPPSCARAHHMPPCPAAALANRTAALQSPPGPNLVRHALHGMLRLVQQLLSRVLGSVQHFLSLVKRVLCCVAHPLPQALLQACGGSQTRPHAALSSSRGASRANNPGGEHRSCGAALGGGSGGGGAASELPLPQPKQEWPVHAAERDPRLPAPPQAKVSPTCSLGAVASPLPAISRGLAPPSRRLLQVSMLPGLVDGSRSLPCLRVSLMHLLRVLRPQPRPANSPACCSWTRRSLHHCSNAMTARLFYPRNASCSQRRPMTMCAVRQNGMLQHASIRPPTSKCVTHSLTAD